ncbi:unnamed protein product [Triticum turgidum subsp. durum]|uniref:Uncharacterized protein n=1 Tax=Triticum turgidum subsp. durum TaxID=4567 RepID=A0A9R0XZM6_TRITD|nr:unnamed protein product [Triticum turgidum subsp. durum]
MVVVSLFTVIRIIKILIMAFPLLQSHRLHYLFPLERNRGSWVYWMIFLMDILKIAWFNTCDFYYEYRICPCKMKLFSSTTWL